MELPPPKNDTAFPHNSVQTTIDNIVDIKYKNSDISPAHNDAGGGQQEGWELDCNRNSESQHFFENIDKNNNLNTSPNRVRKVKNNSSDKNNTDIEDLKIPRIVNPKKYQTVDDLLSAVEFWWVKRYRKDPDTWRKYKNLIVDMTKHPIFPINISNPNPDQVIAQLDFEEAQWIKKRDDKRDKEGDYAIINRWKAIKALMRSYGKLNEVKDNWNYTPPSTPRAKPRDIPSIETVYKMIHHKYSKDRYEKKLYQYIIFFAHMIGPRPASEISTWRTSDIDLDKEILTFYQPKVDKWRQITLPERIVKSNNIKCFKNWIDSWRPKAESQYSKDYMFIQPRTGKPFTQAYLTKKMNENYKPIWSGYYPYSSRHWYATAKLIQSKVKYGVYATREVCNDMNHSNELITKHYTRSAEMWYKVAPFDWFKFLLNFQAHNKTIEKPLEQQKKLSRSKQVRGKMGALLGISSPVGLDEPRGIRTLVTGSEGQ